MILNNNNGDFIGYDFINNEQNVSNIIDSIKEISELITSIYKKKIGHFCKLNNIIEFTK